MRLGIRTHRYLQRLLGASTVGVRAVVLDDQQRVLLVKHTYVRGWHLPGGGVKQKETLVDAIKRELEEEAGIIVTHKPQLMGAYYHQVRGVDDYSIVFLVKSYDNVPSRSIEIAETRWFSLDELPKDIAAGTLRRLNELFSGADISDRW